MEDRVYEACQAQRMVLLEAEQEYGRNSDKYLLALSSGALGLSLTFIREIVPSGDPKVLWLLGTAWALLVLSIGLILVMMRITQDGHEQFRVILDEECAKGGDRFWHRVRDRQQKTWWPNAVGRLNWISLASFCVAIVMLFVFTLVNLSNKDVQDEREQNAGAVVHTVQ